MTDSRSRTRSTPIVAFTSGKGGCGKTTIAVNFARTIHKAGTRVLLVDLDLSNRGATGLLASSMPPGTRPLTLVDLLLERETEHSSAQVRPDMFFLPAGIKGDVGDVNLETFSVRELREKLERALHELARKHEIDCIVLDCFSGVDSLTTAGSLVADHTVLVNEADIVTFAGSLHILNHLEQAAREQGANVRFHFVINRVRGRRAIAELAELYADNLEQVINERVLAYVPYHDRVFRGFGEHPFMVELLPRSLFSRKLGLLARLLFEGSHPKLIQPAVLGWKSAKLQRVYYQSIDSGAVDTEYLILKLTGFPLFAGIWILAAVACLRVFALGPELTWVMMLLLVSAGAMVVGLTLIVGFWLAARLNFTLAEYRWQLIQHGPMRGNHRLALRRASGPFFTGALITLSLAVGGGVFSFELARYLDWAFNVGIHATTGRAEHFGQRVIETALSSPAEIVSLEGRQVKGINLERNPLATPATAGSLRHGLFSPAALLGTPITVLHDTTLVECFLPAQAFNTTGEWQAVDFEDCIFTPADASLLKVTDGRWTQLRLRGLPSHTGFEFRNARLSDVEFELPRGHKLAFYGCELENVVIRAQAVSGESAKKEVRDSEYEPISVYVDEETRREGLDMSDDWVMEVPLRAFRRALIAQELYGEIQGWRESLRALAELQQLPLEEGKRDREARLAAAFIPDFDRVLDPDSDPEELVDSDPLGELLTLVDLYVISEDDEYGKRAIDIMNALRGRMQADFSETQIALIQGRRVFVDLMMTLMKEPDEKRLASQMRSFQSHLAKHGPLSGIRWDYWLRFRQRRTGAHESLFQTVEDGARGQLDSNVLARIFDRDLSLYFTEQREQRPAAARRSRD